MSFGSLKGGQNNEEYLERTSAKRVKSNNSAESKRQEINLIGK